MGRKRIILFELILIIAISSMSFVSVGWFDGIMGVGNVQFHELNLNVQDVDYQETASSSDSVLYDF